MLRLRKRTFTRPGWPGEGEDLEDREDRTEVTEGDMEIRTRSRWETGALKGRGTQENPHHQQPKNK